MRVTREQAAARVRARLGRDAQDPLEAAVVLEAWGGLRPAMALAVARGGRSPLEEPPPLERAGRSPRRIGHVLVQAACVAAGALLLFPLDTALGRRAVADALPVALPVAMALQWLLQRRYLFDDSGSHRFAGEPPLVRAWAALCAATTAGILLDARRAMPWCLVVLWVGGHLLLGARRGSWYLGLVGTTTACVATGLPVRPTLAAATVCSWLLVRACSRRPRPTSIARPLPWSEALLAAAAGALLGSLLLSASAQWQTPWVALGLAPGLCGIAWASAHLGTLWLTWPRVLVRLDVRHRAVSRLWVLGLSLLARSIMRLLLALVALSFLVLELLERIQGPLPAGTLVLEMDAFAIACFFVGVLVGIGRAVEGTAVAAVASVAAHGVRWALPGSADPVLVGGAAALILGAAAVSRHLSAPDRLLAAAA